MEENIINQLLTPVKPEQTLKIQQIQKEVERTDNELSMFELCEKKVIDNKTLKKLLICPEININQKKTDGERILHVLSRNGHLEFVQYILKKHPKIKIDARCNKRKTPLLLAAEHGHLQVLELLEKNGANINFTDGVGNGAIHLAASNGQLVCIKYLVEQKSVIVDLENNYKDTPLHKAAINGFDTCIEYLLNKGANIYHLDIDRENILFKSAIHGHLKCVELVTRYVSDGKICTKFDKENKDTDLLEMLVNGSDKDDKTALSWAAGKGHADVVKHLLERKADVDIQDNSGGTALTWAAGNGHADVVKYLLEQEAAVDIQDNNGGTALTWAAGNGHADVVKHLLERQVTTDIQDNNGRTALSWAAGNGHADVVKHLLERQADVDIQNKTGRTALYWAAKEGHDEIVNALLKANAEVESRDKFGLTPFHLAASKGHLKCVKRFIEAGVNINLTDNRQETILMKAVKTGKVDIVKILIEEGADTRLTNDRGETALDMARTYKMKQLLLSI